MKVLLVEDNDAVAKAIESCLLSYRAGKFNVESVHSMADAVSKLSLGEYDIVLLDLNLPDSHGLDSLMRLKACSPAMPVVVISGEQEDDTALEALRQGAQDFLIKGVFKSEELVQRVRFAYHRFTNDNLVSTIRHMAQEISKLTQELKEVREQYVLPKTTAEHGDPGDATEPQRPG